MYLHLNSCKHTRIQIQKKHANMLTVLANISNKRTLYSISTLSPMIDSLVKYQIQLGYILLIILSLTTVNLMCLI